MTEETNLVLGDIVIPLGAGRSITQTLEPIDNGDLRRTVNGTLRDLTREENRKFSSTVSTSDWSSPAMDGLWKGMILEVQCIAEMRQNLFPADDEVELIRDPVTGTVYGVNEEGEMVEPSSVTGREVIFPEDVRYVAFRPILELMITSLDRSREEYSSEEGWQISFEEV